MPLAYKNVSWLNCLRKVVLVRIAAVQSNFLPWIGYFDLISSVDKFVILDSVQYTKRDWRNRNKILTPGGTTWITVPVETKGKRDQRIYEVKISGSDWTETLSKTLEHAYSKTPYFSELFPSLVAILKRHQNGYLADMNLELIEMVNTYLGVSTEILKSQDFDLMEGKSERLLDLCQKLGGSEYLSGRAAQSYLDEKLFNASNVKLTWVDYGRYPPHSLYRGSTAEPLSVIDGLFAEGDSYGAGRLYRL
jgi:hypothetical protein